MDYTELLTAVEVAQMLKLSPRTVREWAWRQKIPSVKVLGALRFRREDIEALIEVREKK